jgi:hypothetical protein
MRANNKIYHIDCFRCFVCNKQLAPGDEYLLKDDDLFCKLDSENIIQNNGTSCQNITNMQLNQNKILIKCEDLNPSEQQQHEFNGLYYKYKKFPTKKTNFFPLLLQKTVHCRLNNNTHYNNNNIISQ